MITHPFYLALGLCAFAWTPAAAKPQSTVSTAIVFAVDRSSSVSPEEMAAEISAHANALRAPEFSETALQGGRCVGIHYLEWSGVGELHTVLPWTMVCSQDMAETAARLIEQNAGKPSALDRRPRSSLSFAIDAARAAMKHMPFHAKRKIISISTDGVNNDGVPPAESRDRSVKDGYIIDAIALAKAEPGMEDDLNAYLSHNVIGGDGAVARATDSLADYPPLLMQTLLLQTDPMRLPSAARGKVIGSTD